MSIKTRLREKVKTPLYRYQRRGVRFIENADGCALICDDMGLGKTLQSLAWAAIHPELRPMVVVCPATLKYNWQRELKQHANLKSHVCDGNITTKEQDQLQFQKLLEKRKSKKKWWRLSRFQKRRQVIALKKYFREKARKNKVKKLEIRKHKILIVNYEIIQAWLPVLLKLGVQILVLDECHYIKEKKAKRTKACRKLSREVDNVIALSGTPISGKPAEFFPVLNMVRPSEFPSWWKFAFEYCNPVKNKWSGGWDFTGASNLEALHKRLKTVMIRRMKHKVLKELPTKTRSVIPLDITNRKEYIQAEENFLAWLLKKRGKKALERAARAEAIVRMNALKILAAKGKLKYAVEWIKDWFEETDQKLIVFTIHRTIIESLQEHFPKAVVVDGSVSAAPVKRKDKHGRTYETSKRQEAVDKFQNDPKARLLLGQLRAAGQGLNLTAASNVLFMEIGWTPGEHDQAEDRALRIGQKRNVMVYYLVARKTIEEKILAIIHAKDETVRRILDGKTTGALRLLEMFMDMAA